jgi:threonine aldolase
LWSAFVEGIFPSNRHHLTVADVQKAAILREGVYDCPTRIISLENTQSGTIMPLSEVQAISTWAHQLNSPLHVHLDGARLWEAVAAGAGTLKEFTECFDSVSLCFTKGLGAPIGSIIVGTSSFITRARGVRKLLGGGMRQTGIIAAPARIAVEQVFLGKKLKNAQDTAKFIADTWVSLGGSLRNPTETNMIWLDLEAAGIDKPYFAKVAQEMGLKTMQGRLEDRLVVHYQICQEAVDILIHVFRFVLKK